MDLSSLLNREKYLCYITDLLYYSIAYNTCSNFIFICVIGLTYNTCVSPDLLMLIGANDTHVISGLKP